MRNIMSKLFILGIIKFIVDLISSIVNPKKDNKLKRDKELAESIKRGDGKAVAENKEKRKYLK